MGGCAGKEQQSGFSVSHSNLCTFSTAGTNCLGIFVPMVLSSNSSLVKSSGSRGSSTPITLPYWPAPPDCFLWVNSNLNPDTVLLVTQPQLSMENIPTLPFRQPRLGLGGNSNFQLHGQGQFLLLLLQPCPTWTLPGIGQPQIPWKSGESRCPSPTVWGRIYCQYTDIY